MTVTTVPPAVVPLVGVTPLIENGAGVPKVYPVASVAEVPSGLLTVTGTVPEFPLGVRTSSVEELITVTETEGMLPKVTVSPDWNPAPLSVTRAPPLMAPEGGST